MHTPVMFSAAYISKRYFRWYFAYNDFVWFIDDVSILIKISLIT
jgi:hypothetical protein